MPNLLATMVTTTTYGSWLPGDLRGYVEKGIVLPGDLGRLESAKRLMDGRGVVLFSADQQLIIFDALKLAADEFGYVLTDASVESWHLHWLIEHGYDSVATMVGRLKNRMRQGLGIGENLDRGVF